MWKKRPPSLTVQPEGSDYIVGGSGSAGTKTRISGLSRPPHYPMLLLSQSGMMTESKLETLPAPPLSLFEDASLFLDFDGTLVGIEPRPDDVVVGPPLKHLMERLSMKLDGRIAIISGRPSEQINGLFGGVAFAIAGSHGLELRWPDGSMMASPPPANLDAIVAEMQRLKLRHPELLIERKPFGVALHFRLEPEAEGECRRLVTELGKASGLHVQSGKMVFELRAPWADKGTALSFLMAGPQMAGTRPVFVGDDDTDEPAFEAATRLGGAGVLVGQPRPTSAAFGLQDVASVRRWLELGARVQ